MKKKPYRKMRAEFYVDGEIWFHVHEATLERIPTRPLADEVLWDFGRQLDVYRGRIVISGFQEHINR